MRFTLVVHSAPYSSQAPASAYRFATALLEAGHELYRVFFFGDGVHSANKHSIVAQDDINWQAQWDALIEQHNLNSVVCVSSAIKRGVLDETEAKRYDFKEATMNSSSEVAGLGQLIDATVQSDRVINFG